MASAKHVRLDEVPWEQVREGVFRRFVAGEMVMVAQFRLLKGAKVPMHSHHNEQLSYVFEGVLKFILEDGDEQVVKKGEILVIPSNLAHAAEAVEDSFVMDVFAPPREDWFRGENSYLRKKT